MRSTASFAFNKINGTDNSTDSTDDVTNIDFAREVLKGATQKGFIGLIKCVVLAYKIASENTDNVITRGETANYLRRYCGI